MFEGRLHDLRQRLAEANVDVALITDDDNVYYLTGYYDYLHMEFGRPTILVVPKDGPSLLITPVIDQRFAEATARVDRIAGWNDGMGEMARGITARIGKRRDRDRARSDAAFGTGLCR